jgi:leucyl aminopeptidase
VIAVRPLGGLGCKWILLVGGGDGSPNSLRRAAGEAAFFARKKGAKKMSVVFSEKINGQDPEAHAVVEGLYEGNYQFDRYKPKTKQKSALTHVHLMGLAAKAKATARAEAYACGQTLSRNLVNEPAAVIYPESLAAVCEGLSSEQLKVEIWDEKRLKKERMGGIIGVGQGSDRPPRFIHMTWTPKGKPSGHVALVGKGVTFDAGGLSLKPSSGMQTMRCDMGGSAVVAGVFAALDKIQPNVKVEGLIGAAENMLGGNAFKLGDVLKMRNGKTVEIHNTDAEGRLVLADCLSYASELGVDECIDFATLTGAAVVALGERYTALFTDDDRFANGFLKHAENAGEGLWRLPLEAKYKEMLKAEWAELKNVGGRAAGSITAALFLSEFVDGPTWAHFDIAGPTFVSSKTDHFRKGATGAMVRTVLNWLESK